ADDDRRPRSGRGGRGGRRRPLRRRPGPADRPRHDHHRPPAPRRRVRAPGRATERGQPERGRQPPPAGRQPHPGPGGARHRPAGSGAFTTTARRALLDLAGLGGATTAWAISDRGLVVGRSTDAAGQVRAVVWPVHQTQAVDLGTLGGPSSTTGLTTLIVPTSL